jgi:hypothetical protein
VRNGVMPLLAGARDLVGCVGIGRLVGEAITGWFGVRSVPASGIGHIAGRHDGLR